MSIVDVSSQIISVFELHFQKPTVVYATNMFLVFPSWRGTMKLSSNLEPSNERETPNTVAKNQLVLGHS